MQSSPPVHPRHRSPSPTQSEYSLNLEALDLDAQSDVSDGLPQPVVDRIHSEDIDGPSDFTQNMEMWMRGDPIAKKDMRNGKTSQKGANSKMTGDIKAEGGLPSFASPTVPKDKAVNSHIEEIVSPGIPTVEEPPQEDQFSSEWYPNEQSATPAPNALTKLLQPTVEDYHSELTLSHQTPGQTIRNRSFAPDARNQSPFRQSPSRSLNDLRRSVSSRMSPALVGEASRRAADLDESQTRFDLQLKQLQARCDQLEKVNTEHSQALKTERQTRIQETAAYEASIAEAKQRERDLIKLKDAASQEKGDIKHQLDELKITLQARVPQSPDTKILQQMRDEMHRTEAEHIRTVRNLQQDLEHARRCRDDAESLVKAYRGESSEQRELHQSQLERLRLELQHAKQDELAITGLEQQLDAAKLEIERSRDDHRKSENVITTLREQLESNKQSHADQLSRTTGDHIRAIELATTLQHQLQDLRRQLREAQAAQSEQTSKDDQPHAAELASLRKELAAAHSTLESKQIELNEAIVERDAAQDDLHTSQAEAQALRAEMADQQSVNDAVDAQVSEKLRRRESHWRTKLEAAERERDLMAKALMHQWGREETGIDRPQAYAYKYLERNGISAEGVKTRAKAVS